METLAAFRRSGCPRVELLLSGITAGQVFQCAGVLPRGGWLFLTGPAAAAVVSDDLAACSQELGGADPDTVIIVACIAEAVALTGAAVGGEQLWARLRRRPWPAPTSRAWVGSSQAQCRRSAGIIARRRKQELEAINAQLRLINSTLKKQARIESYAPSLSYAPAGRGRVAVEVKTDTLRETLMLRLRSGKRHLRVGNPKAAFEEFQAALVLAQQVGDIVEEKKASRGLGASCQRQRKYKDAIRYHELVLKTSDRTGEHSGDTEACGAIADCYTELGDLEAAAKYYDRYISLLETGNEIED
eukprot:SM000151S01520  [mRNA]  locus=s151:189868:197515:- [translate_table: standard]